MSVSNGPEALVEWAAYEAGRLLREEPDGRGLHTKAVARKASQIGRCLPSDADVLVAAAYLHDIGYSRELRRTGFHPLDGGAHIRALGYERLARLVAHHSASMYMAEVLGLTQVMRLFPIEASFLMDALTYCDMTTDSNGRHVGIEERFAGVLDRYGTNHVVTRALARSEPSLRSCVGRVEEWIASQSNLVFGSPAK